MNTFETLVEKLIEEGAGPSNPRALKRACWKSGHYILCFGPTTLAHVTPAPMYLAFSEEDYMAEDWGRVLLAETLKFGAAFIEPE